MNNESVLVVKDVLGPMPGDCSAFIFMLDQSGKMVCLQSSLADADACRKSITGKSENGRGPYEYIAELLKTVSVELEEARLEFSGDQAYSKLMFKPLAKGGKPLRIVSPNPMMAVNLSLAMGQKLKASSAWVASRGDMLTTYGTLKSIFGGLWPLPDVRHSDQLQALSELVDGTCRASKAS